jgi:chlorobactene glucosyltransferase
VSALGWTLLAALPALPATMTTLNLLTWRRGSVQSQAQPRVSVLVPARNEQACIEACVRAIAGCAYAVSEIIVYDDESSDDTRRILRSLQPTLPTLRVLVGGPLPAGWVGKAHACEQLARAACGEVLLFVDADTVLEPGAVQRVLSFMHPAHGDGAAVVSAVPRQVMGSFAERLMLPLLVLSYTAWLPLFLVQKSRDPRFLAANGQLLAVTRAAYDRLGGFASVAHEIVDDMAFCRRAKTEGVTVAFADGTRMAHCRMYESFGDIWAGFSKNLYEGVGATPWALAPVVLLYLGAFVAPYVGLALALGQPSAWAVALFWPSAIGVSLNVLLRALLAWRFGQPWEGVLLHPFSALLLCLLALNSYRWSARGRLRWAGRSYGDRAQRRAAAS